MNGARALDQLCCAQNHRMEPLPVPTKDDDDWILTCDECGKEFDVDQSSYGCERCDECVCYVCLKDLPKSQQRDAPRREFDEENATPQRHAPAPAAAAK